MVLSLFEVGLSQLVIIQQMIESVLVGLLSPLRKLCLVQLPPGSFNSQRSVPNVNALLLEGLLQLLLEVGTNLWLRCRILIDPQANLVREFLIVETSG